MKAAIDRTHRLLELPDDYLLAITPASDTGAVEMALWSLLGARGVDVLAWESFGKDWLTDIVAQLKLSDVRRFEADYGDLPDLRATDPTRDIVFTWNGTTSGVRAPNADWIAADRSGLTICDATSAVLAQDLEWSKLDVVTFSWQKALGGEAAHGMLVLSPRAITRLESHTPAWPIPKIFRLAKDGKLDRGVFEGMTLNTPSMLCVEDYLSALDWAERLGGLPGLQQRTRDNARVIFDWVAASDWIDFLGADPAARSNTSVCLKIVAPDVTALPPEAQASVARKLARMLEAEGAAFDIGAHRAAPAGLRIWCGATIEKSDLQALTPWLDWAFATLRMELRQGDMA